jgi:hypothetical protein
MEGFEMDNRDVVVGSVVGAEPKLNSATKPVEPYWLVAVLS